MRSIRMIRQHWQSRPTREGAGVSLRRAFGYNEVPLFDPFLLLDDFRSDTPAEYAAGFPWHPHRGIETITYVLQGTVEHGDSLGNQGVISTGDVQWMTAGSGIVHQEMPKGDEQGRMYGFQLWANLPASQKMMEPRYRDVKRELIPVVPVDGGSEVRIISGEYAGVQGPVRDIVIEPQYLDISLSEHSEINLITIPGHNVFIYVIKGSGNFGEVFPGRGNSDTQTSPPENILGNGMLAFFGDGDQIKISTGVDEGVRFLFCSGKPIGEPVAWYGPIVMNTQEELSLAFEELRAGTFIKRQ